MCIDIVEICLGITHGQISSIFDSYLHDNGGVFSSPTYYKVFGDRGTSNEQYMFLLRNRTIHQENIPI